MVGWMRSSNEGRIDYGVFINLGEEDRELCKYYVNIFVIFGGTNSQSCFCVTTQQRMTRSLRSALIAGHLFALAHIPSTISQFLSLQQSFLRLKWIKLLYLMEKSVVMNSSCPYISRYNLILIIQEIPRGRVLVPGGAIEVPRVGSTQPPAGSAANKSCDFRQRH